MASQSVLLNMRGSVATIALNRPEILNAIDLSMAEALVRAIQSCADEDEVGAVIVTGTGRGFCAGGDMKAAWAHIQDGGNVSDFFRDLTIRLHRAITDLRMLRKPVIAAVNGVTGGAGISLAAACDLRLAAESAKFKQAYTSIGLVPDGGWTAIVSQILGPANATKLLLMDPLLDAKQALALGLVHEIIQDDNLLERTRQVAAKLAGGPTTAFGRAKALLNAALLPMLETQLERERQCIIAQCGTADFLEGLHAFVEKRGPRFRGR